MTQKTLKLEDLSQFTGTEYWYRHALVDQVVFTDGVKYMAETGGAYWLIDEIALPQKFVRAIKAERFQVWKLEVRADHSAELTCGDGNGNVVFTKVIEFTDFPLTAIELWFTDNTILLPSEY